MFVFRCIFFLPPAGFTILTCWSLSWALRHARSLRYERCLLGFSYIGNRWAVVLSLHDFDLLGSVLGAAACAFYSVRTLLTGFLLHREPMGSGFASGAHLLSWFYFYADGEVLHVFCFVTVNVLNRGYFWVSTRLYGIRSAREIWISASSCRFGLRQYCAYNTVCWHYTFCQRWVFLRSRAVSCYGHPCHWPSSSHAMGKPGFV